MQQREAAMGLSQSKSDPDQVSPAASWSTLDGFIMSEAGRKRRETIAVNTVVEDDEIKQVKTTLNFPERKPTFNLDVHLNQSVHHHKSLRKGKDTVHEVPLSPAGSETTPKGINFIHCFLSYAINNLSDTEPNTSIMKSTKNTTRPKRLRINESDQVFAAFSEEPLQSKPAFRELNQEFVRSKTRHEIIPSSNKQFRDPAQSKLQRRVTHGAIANPPSSPRLDIRLDAANNLCHEPTDAEIRRKLLQWNNEYALSKNETAVKKVDNKPKHTKAFYELRKALVNRERIELEKSSYVIKKIKPEMPDEQSLVQSRAPIKDALAKSEKSTTKSSSVLEENAKRAEREDSKLKTTSKTKIKIYREEPNFELKISRDHHHGFNIFIETTETEICCKSLMEGLEAKESGVDIRSEIDKLLDTWKVSSFLKIIEDQAYNCPLEYTSPNEIAQSIASSDADYLVSLSSNDLHTQVAKAYAIYCWIARYVAFKSTSKDNDHDFNEDYGLFDEESVESAPMVSSFDYANLFKEVAFNANLEAEIITGEVRNWANQLSTHAWNIVS